MIEKKGTDLQEGRKGLTLRRRARRGFAERQRAPVGRQRFSVRGLRLDRRDKGVILKGKEGGLAGPFEACGTSEAGSCDAPLAARGKPGAISGKIVHYISDFVKSNRNNSGAHGASFE